MGHKVNPYKEEYLGLQERLDKTVTGAPFSPTFMKILEILFSPEDAKIARKIPTKFSSIGALSRKLGVPKDELADKITDMAHRGLVIDVEYKGKRYASLAPVVIGFFEFTFMRARDDLDIVEIARLFETYMKEESEFSHSLFQGSTQIGRSLVREEALPLSDFTEILDWERATYLISSAKVVGVSLCACRHKNLHLGKACEAPMKNCLSLNFGADAMIRAGIAERISNEDGLKILAEAKDAGLAQTGDNVQRNPTYICNCCGCCCGMVSAIKTFKIKNAIVTSNWVMGIELDKCNGCGKCVVACPISAIHREERMEGKKRVRWAEVNDDLCLGCGVCYSACKYGAISMKRREKRVFTPETVFDKMVAMAIERGKLADLIFEEPEKLNHKALRRIVWLLERSPPVKAALAIKPLRSVFIETVVKGAKKLTGPIAEEMS